jgi:GNAT superfamily N-acetyltransferase
VTEDRVSLPRHIAQALAVESVTGERGLRATLPGIGFTWWSQVGQYPKTGPSGVSYFRGEMGDGSHVDCLLFRDDDGVLRGVLNHYNVAYPDTGEEPGDYVVIVEPAWRRQGIGRILLTEALGRWDDIDLARQKYTAEGLALTLSVRNGA